MNVPGRGGDVVCESLFVCVMYTYSIMLFAGVFRDVCSLYPWVVHTRTLQGHYKVGSLYDLYLLVPFASLG